MKNTQINLQDFLVEVTYPDGKIKLFHSIQEIQKEIQIEKEEIINAILFKNAVKSIKDFKFKLVEKDLELLDLLGGKN
jgi:hypothetical protein